MLDGKRSWIEGKLAGLIRNTGRASFPGKNRRVISCITVTNLRVMNLKRIRV